MAAHSSILAWRIPWTEEPDKLHSMGSQRVNRTERQTLSLLTFTQAYVGRPAGETVKPAHIFVIILLQTASC